MTVRIFLNKGFDDNQIKIQSWLENEIPVRKQTMQ